MIAELTRDKIASTNRKTFFKGGYGYPNVKIVKIRKKFLLLDL